MPPRRTQLNTTDTLQVVRLDQLVLLDQMQVREHIDLDLVEDSHRLFVAVGEETGVTP